jgi:hypothetical protein
MMAESHRRETEHEENFRSKIGEILVELTLKSNMEICAKRLWSGFISF